MTVECLEWLATESVPEPNRPVAAGSSDASAIGAKTGGVDLKIGIVSVPESRKRMDGLRDFDRFADVPGALCCSI